MRCWQGSGVIRERDLGGGGIIRHGVSKVTRQGVVISGIQEQSQVNMSIPINTITLELREKIPPPTTFGVLFWFFIKFTFD